MLQTKVWWTDEQSDGWTKRRLYARPSGSIKISEGTREMQQSRGTATQGAIWNKATYETIEI